MNTSYPKTDNIVNTFTGIDYEIELNLDLIKKSVKSFVAATNVACIVIDANGEMLYDAKSEKNACAFCHKIQEMTNIPITCEKAHLYGSIQAERFGGQYIYFCPSGMVHISSPIIIGGIMKAALIGGPILGIDKEEYIAHDLMIKNNIGNEHLEEFEKYFENIAVVQPENVNHLSYLLFMISSHISDVGHAYLKDNQENQKQQNDINEYIQSVKNKAGEDLPNYPMDKEKELLSVIAQGDKSTSQRLLNEILGHIFFSSGGKFDLIKARVLELVVLLSRAAMDGGADTTQILGLNYGYFNEVDNFRTIEELSYWLSKIISRFTDFVFNFNDVKHIDVIYKAIDFINNNYMKKISLEQVASHVFLSPSYFSKVFKDEMKCNFSVYLNKIRIEKSKKFLLSDNVNLVDISDMVGFEDQSYFSKVFKRITGVTPGKYRESRGKIK